MLFFKKKLETRSLSAYDSMFATGGLPFGRVSARQAEGLSAVYAAVELISTAMATARPKIYRSDGVSRSLDTTHPLNRVLLKPSRNFSYFQLIRQLFSDMLLFGNGVAVYDDGELFPVAWQSVTMQQNDDGTLIYNYSKPTIKGSDQRRTTQDNVLHLRDRHTGNTLVGSPRLSRCAPAIQFALEVQQASIATWSNSAAPSAALQTKDALQPEEKARLQEAITAAAARHKRGSVVILDNDLNWQSITTNQLELEAQATREWIVIEVARVYGIPPPLLQDYTRANYSNAVEASRFLNRIVLAAHARNFEDEFTNTFLSPPYHLVLDRSEFSRENLKERYDSYKIAIETGVLTSEQVRRLEGYEDEDTARDGNDTDNTD